MSVTRVIAKACALCREPITEDTGTAYSRDVWVLLLNGRPAHTECANEATKEREFKE